MFKQVPLSSYSQNDILEAFRKKIKEKVVTKKHTAAMQDVHESYQVREFPLKILLFQIVMRVKESKKKFSTIGKGAVQREKFTSFMGQVCLLAMSRIFLENIRTKS